MLQSYNGLYRAIKKKKNEQLIHLTTRINVKERHKGAPTVRFHFYATQYCVYSSARSYLTFATPMDPSMPAFPVLYYFPEFAQIQVH